MKGHSSAANIECNTHQDSLEQFKENQRARYFMSQNELAKEISKEHSQNNIYLLGKRLLLLESQCKDTSKDDFRFPNELAALFSFVNAAIVLQGPESAMVSVCRQVSKLIGSSCRSATDKQTTRPRAKTLNNSFEPSFSKSLDDFVDLKSRLSQLPEDQLDLLISYYVLQKDAKALSKGLGVDVSSIGGRLSQARRALARALEGLIPRRSRNRRKHDVIKKPLNLPSTISLLAERKAKVSKFLTKKQFGNDVGKGIL